MSHSSRANDLLQKSILSLVSSQGKSSTVTGSTITTDLPSPDSSSQVIPLNSIMSVPVMIQNKAVGLVSIERPRSAGAFSADDMELLATLTNFISVAFDTSRTKKIGSTQPKVSTTESEKVQLMVDHMQQALFLVDSNGHIVEPVSKFTEKILGKNVVNRHIVDVLFADQNEEKREQIRSALVTVFGESELQWALCEDIFPAKILMTSFEFNQQVVLRIQKYPVWNEFNVLEKILFVAEDVTEVEKLEIQIQAERAQAKYLEEIIKNDRDEVQSLLVDMNKLISGYMNEVSLQMDIERTQFLRDLHTQKGNARLFGLGVLSAVIHKSETAILAIPQNEFSSPEANNIMSDELTNVAVSLSMYLNLLEKISAATTVTSEFLNPISFERLKNEVELVTSQLTPEAVKALGRAIERLTYQSAYHMTVRFQPMAYDICAQLGKKCKLRVQGEALFSKFTLQLLQDTLVHLIRNSLDHGIETPEVRARSKKPEQGLVLIQYLEEKDFNIIEVSDDGAGMVAHGILKKAIEMNLISHEAAASLNDSEKLALIFLPSFSMKQEVSDISGRGVGMDAVTNTIRKMGGEISVQSVFGQGTKFIIKIKS